MVPRSGTRGSTSRTMLLRVVTKKPSTSSCYQVCTNKHLRSCAKHFPGGCEPIIALFSLIAISHPETSWFKMARSKALLIGRIADGIQNTGSMSSSFNALRTRDGRNTQGIFSGSYTMMSWLILLRYPSGRTLSLPIQNIFNLFSSLSSKYPSLRRYITLP